jgi:endoribonuclease Dicer
VVHVTEAFFWDRKLELNLDSIICAPLLFREDLKRCVHRPRFKRVIYAEPEYLLKGTSLSRSLESLKSVVDSMDIEEDPFVLNLRAELQQQEPGPQRDRTDQRLSRAIHNQDSFTHKGLQDFRRAADEICSDLGEWAADWYIHQVCKHAADAGRTFQEYAFPKNEGEKEYLLEHLSRVEITPIPEDDPEDILRRSADKVEKLVDTLLKEKAFFEENEEKKMDYRGIVFVTRRDAVLALTEILARHPRTAHVFTVGSLLGESGNSRRHSFLDITRCLLRQPLDETLQGFSTGDLNLIVATAVAEEGLDIQACCNVVRWDVPPNMVSWAQSRGRARQELSSSILMLSDSLAFEPVVRKWEQLEKEMNSLYNTRPEYQVPSVEDEDAGEDGSLRYRVDVTK